VNTNQYVRIRIWNTTRYDSYWIPVNGNEQAIRSLKYHIKELEKQELSILEATAEQLLILGTLGAQTTTEQEVDEYWVPIAGETKLQGTLTIPEWQSSTQTREALENGGITKLMNPVTEYNLNLAAMARSVTYTRFNIYNEQDGLYEGFWIPTKGNELAIEKLKRHFQLLEEHLTETGQKELVLENGTQIATREDIDNYWSPKLGDMRLLGWLHTPHWTDASQVHREIQNGQLPNLMFTTPPETEPPTTALNGLADTLKTLTENILTVVDSLNTVANYLEAVQKETTKYINQHQPPTNTPETQD
jgi:hypothetical protein